MSENIRGDVGGPGDPIGQERIDYEDYTEEDRWDWDRSDMAQRCKHGTFTGSWWGPDLMCGACEMGDPDITVNDVLKRKEMYQAETEKAFTAFGQLYAFAKTPKAKDGLIEAMKHLNVEAMAKQKRYDDQILEIREWAESDDDNDWLQRQYDAQMKERNARS